ncbi:FAD-binding protein [Nocardia huaxiensis]|uniref:L-aspartate oxidase n=1 Tax=Nocardia huaxiensis TaxID=2755382 RepID=A0A7D6VC26_9NOCA|nr:FAD-binding protein [Nocardia huaxiensis]QLY32821.1 FAD-binding protein [Nocardia huaxiensis]UFS93434.1 FAD-binding protein [Nocardia huaxiensis]
MTEFDSDVLVVGGGPAGAWAALAAAAAGARVIVVDKARCGSSGPTAQGVVTLWNIPIAARDEAVRQNFVHGGGLGDPDWMYLVMEETHRRVGQLVRGGFRFQGEQPGRPARVYLDGAKYLGRLRRSMIIAGVRILDHHPALQLITDGDGTVSGASGVALHGDGHTWTARARAVVVATGGCAFLSGGAGTEVATGDGLLMGAEAGAELSGMEFSNAYSLAPAANSGPHGSAAVFATDHVMHFATLTDESRSVLSGRGCGSRAEAFAAIADGRRVYADLEEMPENVRADLCRSGGPDWLGRVPLRAVLEGTVRGTGGLRLAGLDCATTIPGLYGAGDVTTREPVTGAVSGFGGQNGAWAISSGVWAGAGAARYARTRRKLGKVRAVPGAGLGPKARIDPRAVIGLVQEHTVPLRRSYWRSDGSLRDSIAELDGMWPGVEFDLGGAGADRLHARQAAALLAVARWSKYSALARTETRGMHRRTDHPGAGTNWRVRLLAGGLDRVWVRSEQVAATVPEESGASTPIQVRGRRRAPQHAGSRVGSDGGAPTVTASDAGDPTAPDLTATDVTAV